jgi:hypothetical protein
MTAPYQNRTVALPDQFRHGQNPTNYCSFIIVDRASRGKFFTAAGCLAVMTSKIAQ